MTVMLQLQVDPWIIFLLIICGDIESNPGPNAYEKIKICNLNIRSINAEPKQGFKLSRFSAFKQALAGNYDVITVTESWLNAGHPSENYALPGYNGPFRLDRPDGTAYGGVAAWVVDTLATKRMLHLEEKDHETMWLMINNKAQQLLLAISYRQKKGDFAPNYWTKLQSGYDKAVATKIPNIVLVGDFNADPGTQKTDYDILADFLSTNNLTQHIQEPTRITPTNASKLDLIISNLPMLVFGAGVGGPVHENDHCTIFGTINLKTIKRQPFMRDMWNFKDANFDLFREELSNVNWDSCLDSENIDDICDNWSAKFLEISERIITKKRVKVRPYDKNWYNNYLRRLKRIKDREHGTWVKNRTDLQWEIYKAARNKYFQECDRLKLEYEEHIYSSLADQVTKNPKKWWTMVGEIMGTSKKSSYPVIIKDGVQCLTDKEKAQAFNQTYLDSSNLTGDNFELDDPIEDIDHEVLEHIEITEKDVEDVIKGINTNKAYGPDNISPRLIKEAGPSIVKVLTRIFNKSLQLAKFPSLWKKANVLPIYKKAEDFITTNYRPVSLLSILAKKIEKIVFKYLFNYFKDNFLISIWQSGFVPGSSTITQFTEIYDQFCKAVNNGKEIRVFF